MTRKTTIGEAQYQENPSAVFSPGVFELNPPDEFTFRAQALMAGQAYPGADKPSLWRISVSTSTDELRHVVVGSPVRGWKWEREGQDPVSPRVVDLCHATVRMFGAEFQQERERLRAAALDRREAEGKLPRGREAIEQVPA